MKTIKGIRTAVNFLNKQCVFGRVYLNTQTKVLTTLQYADANSSTVFENENMIEIYRFNARNGKVTMSEIKAAAEAAC